MEILKELEVPTHPNLLQSFEEGADAAIYKLTSEVALVFSADFFTPVVDDPFVFGQIAAANSLSDIYVSGAKPLLALNLISFPKKGVPKEILKEILKGGLYKIKEAGALLVGGHSVEDPEPKYGLAVIGIAHPDRIITNKNAKPGDLLYLTKPLGLGILLTAYKAKLIFPHSEIYQKMIDTMTELNNKIAEIMLDLELKGATDVTGFGLLGHALEMALASKKTLIIYASQVPYFEEAKEFIKLGLIPEGDYNNLNFCKKLLEVSSKVSEEDLFILADAQTSGGFLLCVPKEKQYIFEEKAKEKKLFIKLIGEVKEGNPCLKILL